MMNINNLNHIKQFEINDKIFKDYNLNSKKNFFDFLKDNIQKVDDLRKIADEKSNDLASGKSDNIKDAMIASVKSELSFKLMVQVRNKALEAYQQIMRMNI